MTTEHLQKIYLLSDVEIYEEVVNFVRDHLSTKVSKAQLSGLQNAVLAGNRNEIFRYIDNRLARNTTPNDVRTFYHGLKDDLNSLRSKVQEAQFVDKPEKTTRAQDKQLNEKINRYIYLLGKEYIQHLIAEYNYQRILSNA